MKPKNKERKGKKRMDNENNSRAFGVYQENKHGLLTPYKYRTRKPKIWS